MNYTKTIDNGLQYAKDVVKDLHRQKSSYTSPESAQDQANSLESLSSDIYTDSKRFIYELLQNADDASFETGKLEMQIAFIDDHVVISHQGESFSEVDIESICSVGDGNKKGDENKTGFKGIGFKSVFSHAACVGIHTGKYSFRFDKKYWTMHWDKSWGEKKEWEENRNRKGKDLEVKMPWQIIPIWTDYSDVPSQLTKILTRFNVSTIIRHDKIEQLQAELFNLFSNTQILLFLRSVEVDITILGKEVLKIQKRKENEIVRLHRNGSLLSEWLVNTSVFEVDMAMKKLIENDTRIPKKLRQISKTEISFAVQFEKGKIKKVDKENRLVFTYLPTSVNYDFPFLVNASFLTDAGRQHLHDDLQWNIWLFEQIPLKLFSWIAELALKPQYRDQILKLVPNNLERKGFSELAVAFNKGFKNAVESIPFIPNIDGRLLKVKDVVYDKTRISEIISKQLIARYISSYKPGSFSAGSFIGFFESVSVLNRLGVQTFEIEDLELFFASRSFKKNHKLKRNFPLIRFLFGVVYESQSEEKERWYYKLRATSFIFDQNLCLRSPQEIYFPSVAFSNDFSKNLFLVHPKVLLGIKKQIHLERWLKSLGVKEPTDVSFIEKTILLKKDFISPENAISVGRYVYSAHKKGLLQEDHYLKLGKLKILTIDGKLVPADQSFLSNFYSPDFKLESVYDHDLYTSNEYLEDGELKSEWKTFFIKIGVAEKLAWVEYEIRSHNTKNDFAAEFFKLKAGFPNIGYPNPIDIYKVNRISFIQFCLNNYEFSKIFWDYVLKNNLVLSDSKDMGHCWYFKWRELGIIPYFDWILKNTNIIPTCQGRCLPAGEVYLNKNEIKDLAGQYLPVFDFDGSIPAQWLNKLPFKETLGLVDLLDILSSIWHDDPSNRGSEKNANQQRIAMIYEKLAKEYLAYGEELAEWGENNKLLAKNKKDFLFPSELAIVTVDGFKAANLAYCDTQNKQVIELLRNIGVSVIDHVEASISNSLTEINDLKEKLLNVLPLIVSLSLEKSKSSKDWQEEFQRLKKRLSKIRFFETTEIYLSYGNDSDKQERSSWADGNKFYYVGNWYKPRILDALVEPLGKFLGIRYAERHLSVLLSDAFTEGLAYLKEKFGNEAIRLIPEILLHPQEPKNTLPNANNRAYNQSDETLGRKGELYVFEQLKKLYSEKYDMRTTETTTGFKIGNKVEVIWRNISENTTSDHDFKVIEQGHHLYIDSKATPYDETILKIPFYLSPNEFTLMQSTDRYFIARVFNVATNPYIKFIRLSLDQLG